MKCPRCGDDDHDGPVCTCGGSPMKRKQEQIRGKLWNWLHDDLRKDEAKNALKRKKVRKVHRHRYDRCLSKAHQKSRERCYQSGWVGFACRCGAKKP